MTAAKEDLLPLGPWVKGVNNRAPEEMLGADELRAGVNVDITSTGDPRTRSGYRKVISGQSMHSLYGHRELPFALAVDNNALKAYPTDFDPAGVVTIRSDLKPAQTVSYAYVNGEVYWSDGFDSGRVGEDRLDRPFALAGPAGSPNLSATSGALPQGGYQVVCTFLSTSGEESGSTQAAYIDLPNGGGITVSQIPQPTDPSVMLVRLYVTEPNGDLLYWLRDLAVNVTTATIGNVVSTGKHLTPQQQWMTPLPPGQIVRAANGRILVASDNVLWISLGLRGAQTMRSTHFITFKHRIALLEPVGQGDECGWFVTSGKRTYWLPGEDPKQAQMKIAHPFGAVPGTGLTVPGWYFNAQLKSEAAFWMDDVGVPILGIPGGGIITLAADRYAAPLAEQGSSLIRDINGIRSIITNLRGVAANTARATDSVVATVSRNGVVI